VLYIRSENGFVYKKIIRSSRFGKVKEILSAFSIHGSRVQFWWTKNQPHSGFYDGESLFGQLCWLSWSRLSVGPKGVVAFLSFKKAELIVYFPMGDIILLKHMEVWWSNEICPPRLCLKLQQMRTRVLSGLMVGKKTHFREAWHNSLSSSYTAQVVPLSTPHFQLQVFRLCPGFPLKGKLNISCRCSVLYERKKVLFRQYCKREKFASHFTTTVCYFLDLKCIYFPLERR